MSDTPFPPIDVIDADDNPLRALLQLADTDPSAREAVRRVALMALALRAVSEVVSEIPALDGVGRPFDPRTHRVLDSTQMLALVEALPEDIHAPIREVAADLRALARNHNAQLHRWYAAVAELRDAFAHMSARPEYPLVMKLLTEVMASAQAAEGRGDPFPLLTMMKEQGLDWPTDHVADERFDAPTDPRAADEPWDESVLRARLQAVIGTLPEGDRGPGVDGEPELLPSRPARTDGRAGIAQPGPGQLAEQTAAARCRRTIRRYQWAVGALCAAAMVLLVIAGVMTHAAQERASDATKRANVRIADVKSEAQRAVERARATLDAPVDVEVERLGHAPFHWLADLPSTAILGDTKITVSRQAER